MQRLVRGLWLTLLPLALTGGTPQTTSRALLIGIQTYTQLGEDWWNLDGPANDIALVHRVLIDRLGFQDKNIVVLQDRAATRDAITGAFKRLIKDTRQGDRVYIHYSGHGSSVADKNGDEGVRRKDSTLVPVDGWGKGAYQILDDEIAVWVDRLLDKTPDVVFVVDACHSGTITRGTESLKVRGVSIPDSRDYTWSDSLRTALAHAEKRDLKQTHFVQASACRDDEEAHEYEAPDGRIYGLFTWAWCEALTRASDDATLGDLFRVVEARVFREKGSLQEPQLEGATGRFAFAGGHARGGSGPQPRLAVLSGQGTTVTFRGGLLSGVTVGSVYARVGSPEVRAEVVSVSADQAVAKLSGTYTVKEGDLFAEVVHKNGFPPIRVRLDADPAMKAEATELGKMVSTSGRLQLVTGKQSADMVLALRASACRIQDAGLAPWGNGRINPQLLDVSISGEDGLRQVERHLNRLAENETLLRIADAYQDSTAGVEVKLVELVPPRGRPARSALTCVRQPPSPDLCPDCFARKPLASGRRSDETVHLGNGRLLSFCVRNRTANPVFVYMVNVMPSGEVVSLSAPGSEPAFVVAPLDSMALETASRLLDSPGLIDTYLCFVVDEPLPLWNLNLSPLVTDANESVSRGSNDAVRDLIGLAGEETRGASRGALLAARRFSVLVGM